MINLLFLKGAMVSDEDLLRAFHKAGYQVTEVKSAANCSQYVLDGDADMQHDPRLHQVHALLSSLVGAHWRLSMRARRLWGPNGLSVHLTSLEFNFLKLLATMESGEAASRKSIVQAFGEDYLSYDQNRLDTMVKRLRRKVQQEAGLALPLHTVRVKGFAFDDVLVIEQ